MIISGLFFLAGFDLSCGYAQWTWANTRAWAKFIFNRKRKYMVRNGDAMMPVDDLDGVDDFHNLRVEKNLGKSL